ncbi:hypothetical protein [Verrucomicrobium sp. BvORR034]|uniref:hypothetical protein n=1 Tax=Verrucomicrobium sp. BvORR034 TaxID=1396418 RepID=UPI000678E5F3|nr:hypothetical protein [Verrucomicrobium sp. BvORR034]
MNCYDIYVCEGDSIRIEPNVAIGQPNPLGPTWDEGLILNVPGEVDFVTYLKKNKAYDWVGGYSWQPYVKAKVKTRLVPLLGSAVQWIGPIPHKNEEYYMLNCVNIVDCQPHEEGWPHSVNSHFAADQAMLFRLKGSVRRLIATESLKANIFASGDTGIRMALISQNGAATWFHDAGRPRLK